MITKGKDWFFASSWVGSCSSEIGSGGSCFGDKGRSEGGTTIIRSGGGEGISHSWESSEGGFAAWEPSEEALAAPSFSLGDAFLFFLPLEGFFS